MKVTLQNAMFVVACLFMVYALYQAYVLFRMYMGFRRLDKERDVKKSKEKHETKRITYEQKTDQEKKEFSEYYPDSAPSYCKDNYSAFGKVLRSCPCQGHNDCYEPYVCDKDVCAGFNSDWGICCDKDGWCKYDDPQNK